MWKYDQEGFFFFKFKLCGAHTSNITKLVQMILSAWFGYFEYVDYLPHGILLTVLKYCLSFIAIMFNWSTQPWSIIQQKITHKKLHKML